MKTKTVKIMFKSTAVLLGSGVAAIGVGIAIAATLRATAEFNSTDRLLNVIDKVGGVR
ncbi:hypothetical protein GYM67_04085 [Bifidobacterium asteroides]|uniref:hypothetical protein n=1 Tax=Bifidobacterium TaxID=1678 RepID=UPI001C6A4142|nr:hypothetical protein [Bifidobacterium asteroides]QYN60334.1 hypothetical protein GYM67_04085 [Bifidobacterium asteroides]